LVFFESFPFPVQFSFEPAPLPILQGGGGSRRGCGISDATIANFISSLTLSLWLSSFARFFLPLADSAVSRCPSDHNPLPGWPPNKIRCFPSPTTFMYFFRSSRYLADHRLIPVEGSRALPTQTRINNCFCLFFLNLALILGPVLCPPSLLLLRKSLLGSAFFVRDSFSLFLVVGRRFLVALLFCALFF